MFHLLCTLHHHFAHLLQVVLFLPYLVRHALIELLLADWFDLRVILIYLCRVRGQGLFVLLLLLVSLLLRFGSCLDRLIWVRVSGLLFWIALWRLRGRIGQGYGCWLSATWSCLRGLGDFLNRRVGSSRMLVILLKNVLPGAILVHFHQEIVEFLLKGNGEGLI